MTADPVEGISSPDTILVVEDHQFVRLAVLSMLRGLDPGLRILEAGTLANALRLHAAEAPRIALVLLDLHLPDVRGLSALHSFKQAHPLARVIVLSGSVDEAIAGEAIAQGAEQFLLKTLDAAGLRAALAQALASPGCGGEGATPRATARLRRLGLSPRELEILELLLQGCSNQEIADSTGLRMGTVKNYISGLLVVFGAASRSKLVSLFH